MYSEISISKLKPIVNNITLIDIRDEHLYHKEHIPNSVHIPIYKLLSDPSFYLKENNTYYLYCTNGSSSRYASTSLAKKGYHMINVLGGYRQWLLEK